MVSDAKDHQVLVVGAGPTGLVLTLILLRNGVRVRLIEKDLAARIGQRGAGIMPRSLELFHLLGVSRDIESRGIYSPRVRLYDMPDGIIPVQTFAMQPWIEPTPACPYLNIQHLGQDNLETILRDSLAQLHCHVEQASELLSFEQYADHVTAHIKTKTPHGDVKVEATNFDYVIGTDGARGVVRKLLELSFLGETRVVEHLVVGDVNVDGLTEDYWHMWGDAATTLVSLRPTETPRSFNFMIAGCEVDHASLANDEDAVVEFIYNHTGRMCEKGMVVREVTWLSHYKPNIRMVDTFGKGRVLIAGDAAHVHSPTGGQGINTGIQDAFNLGWKLALVVRGLAEPSLLDTFTEERLPVIADMLDQTTLILKKAFNGRGRTEDEKHWVEVHGVEKESEEQFQRETDEEDFSADTFPSEAEPEDSDSEEDWDSEDDDERTTRRQNKDEEARPGSLFQLGVNYRWSSILVDEQEQPSKQNKAQVRYQDASKPSVFRHDSYGRGFDGGLKAGDRAPDAPGLRGVHYPRGKSSDSQKVPPTNLTTRLFDVFDPSYHTVLLFTKPGESLTRYAPIMDSLQAYPKDRICTLALFHAGIQTQIPMLEGIEYYLEDSSSFATDAYDLRGGCGVVVVRPDGFVGAVVKSVEGVQRYFDGVFSKH